MVGGVYEVIGADLVVFLLKVEVSLVSLPPLPLFANGLVQPSPHLPAYSIFVSQHSFALILPPPFHAVLSLLFRPILSP